MVTTGGNIADITAAEDLVEAIPVVAGRRGRPRKRPDAILADKGYDSRRFRESLQANGIMPVTPRRGTKVIIGLGKIQWVVERTISWLHQYKRLTIRWEHVVARERSSIARPQGRGLNNTINAAIPAATASQMTTSTNVRSLDLPSRPCSRRT